MISFLNILTVLYLISFVLIYDLTLDEEKKEILSFIGLGKKELKIMFFTFPFVMLGIFVKEMFNVFMFLIFEKIPKTKGNNK